MMSHLGKMQGGVQNLDKTPRPQQPGTEHTFIFMTPLRDDVSRLALGQQFLRVRDGVGHFYQVGEIETSKDGSSVALVCIYLGPVVVI